jgi:hypothetical protein
MAKYNKGIKGSSMTMALGRMVGLLLSLYVFDEVIDAVVPSLVTCGATHPTVVATSTITTPLCTNGTANIAGTFGVHFSTAISFVGNLFPVVGILGAFEIIYGALKRAGMV